MVRTASTATLRSADAGAQPRSAAQAARIRLNLRRLRLASGLVLFGYVLTHLLNHALGNVSLDAMEDGLDLVTAVWLNPVGLTLLYGALVTHLLLGLQALYAARFFRWRPPRRCSCLRPADPDAPYQPHHGDPDLLRHRGARQGLRAGTLRLLGRLADPWA